MDSQPVFTALHNVHAPSRATLLTLQGKRRGPAAWGLATSGVRLLSDFREAPSMGPRAAGRAFQRLSQALALSSRVRVHVDSHLPSGPCVLVANHQSYLDPVIVGSLVPCLPIAKVEVIQWPIVGELARRYGALFVESSSLVSRYRVLRSALAHLLEGGTILNFPEGEPSNAGVGRFQRAIFGLATLASVPVVPVSIAMGASLARQPGQTPATHCLTALRHGPHDVFVRFGKPLPPGPDAKLAARLARARIQLMLEELRSVNGLAESAGCARRTFMVERAYVG